MKKILVVNKLKKTTTLLSEEQIEDLLDNFPERDKKYYKYILLSFKKYNELFPSLKANFKEKEVPIQLLIRSFLKHIEVSKLEILEEDNLWKNITLPRAFTENNLKQDITTDINALYINDLKYNDIHSIRKILLYYYYSINSFKNRNDKSKVIIKFPYELYPSPDPYTLEISSLINKLNIRTEYPWYFLVKNNIYNITDDFIKQYYINLDFIKQSNKIKHNLDVLLMEERFIKEIMKTKNINKEQATNYYNNYIKHIENLKNNDCEHVNIYRNLRSSNSIHDKLFYYNQLKEFFSSVSLRSKETEGFIECIKCKYNIMCSHYKDLLELKFNKKSMYDIEEKLRKYNYHIPVQQGGTNDIFCKICLEQMVYRASSSDYKQIQYDDLQKEIWGKILYLINTFIDIKGDYVLNNKNLATIASISIREIYDIKKISNVDYDILLNAGLLKILNTNDKFILKKMPNETKLSKQAGFLIDHLYSIYKHEFAKEYIAAKLKEYYSLLTFDYLINDVKISDNYFVSKLKDEYNFNDKQIKTFLKNPSENIFNKLKPTFKIIMKHYTNYYKHIEDYYNDIMKLKTYDNLYDSIEIGLKLFISNPDMYRKFVRNNKLTLANIYDENGYKHKWDIILFGTSGASSEEYSKTEIKKKILDGTFVLNKIVDFKCSVCGILQSDIDSLNVDNIKYSLDIKTHLISFYNYFYQRCPKNNNLHEFVGNTCKNCKITFDIIFNKDINFYNTWKDVFHNLISEEKKSESKEKESSSPSPFSSRREEKGEDTSYIINSNFKDNVISKYKFNNIEKYVLFNLGKIQGLPILNNKTLPNLENMGIYEFGEITNNIYRYVIITIQQYNSVKNKNTSSEFFLQYKIDVNDVNLKDNISDNFYNKEKYVKLNNTPEIYYKYCYNYFFKIIYDVYSQQMAKPSVGVELAEYLLKYIIKLDLDMSINPKIVEDEDTGVFDFEAPDDVEGELDIVEKLVDFRELDLENNDLENVS